MNSSIFTLNLKDLGKGIVTAVLTALVTAVSQTISMGQFPTGAELLIALKVAGVAGIAYLIKNLITNDEGQLLAKNVN